MNLLTFKLVKTTRRLTFDILFQDERTIWMGDDDGDYHFFRASNGYEVISRSRMDIQTERVWLLGAKHAEEGRSGSMVFSSDEKRDRAYDNFILALKEWAEFNGGEVTRVRSDYDPYTLPVDPDKIVQDHAKSLADEIDRQVMIKVGLKVGADIHAGDGGYGIGTREAYEEFVRKRNAGNSST